MAPKAHWQAGHKPGTVPGTASPKVEVVDSKWKAGQQLKSSEIDRDEASDTVELDRGLLLRQFDLLAEERP